MVATIVYPLLYEPDEIARLALSDPVAAEAFAREHCVAMAEDIEASVAEMANKPGPDGAVYARPEIRDMFVANRREAFRQGPDGPAYAIVEINLPWQFRFEDVSAPVRYWLGDEDHATSPALVDTAVGHLPNYEVTIYPREGHAIMFTHGDEILAELAQSIS
jgi:pimeloyl-ACP methyl ester carboxylesterase